MLHLLLFLESRDSFVDMNILHTTYCCFALSCNTAYHPFEVSQWASRNTRTSPVACSDPARRARISPLLSLTLTILTIPSGQVFFTNSSKWPSSSSVNNMHLQRAVINPKIADIFVYKPWRNEIKWNESGFRPPLCTYRLNWARRTSWGWWDDWDDTVLQTQDSKFEPWRSEAEHATSRSRRLPTILTFTRGWGRNIFVSFKPPRPRPGTEPRTLAWKAAVLTTTLGPPPKPWRSKVFLSIWNHFECLK